MTTTKKTTQKKTRRPRSRPPGAGTVGLIHLGCPKNQVDSEEMLAALAQDGWVLVGDPGDADVLVVNTCGFIEAAKQESIAAIRGALRQKRNGRCRGVVVAGCYAQRYAQEIARDYPDVDAVIGVGHNASLPRFVRAALEGERPVVAPKPCARWDGSGARLLTTPPWTAYIRIGEGCDHRCSFCAIPGIRGPWRSRPPELVLDEVRMMVDNGLKEAVLIAQDTTLYGKDWGREGGGWTLAKLVREIGRIEGLRWQRIMYAHPGRITPEIIELFGDVGNLAAYIDLPFQHGDDAVLKKMLRPGSARRYLDLLGRLRERDAGVAVRSTFLVGFPGETDAAFERTCAFLEQAQLDHAGVFVYSREDGTTAYDLGGGPPADVAQERAARLMEIQAGISARRLASLVGREIDVLVEQKSRKGVWLGRSERDAPGVDGTVTLLARRARPGEIVRARVTGTSTHDMVARVDDEPADKSAD